MYTRTVTAAVLIFGQYNVMKILATCNKYCQEERGVRSGIIGFWDWCLSLLCLILESISIVREGEGDGSGIIQIWDIWISVNGGKDLKELGVYPLNNQIQMYSTV